MHLADGIEHPGNMGPLGGKDSSGWLSWSTRAFLPGIFLAEKSLSAFRTSLRFLEPNCILPLKLYPLASSSKPPLWHCCS